MVASIVNFLGQGCYTAREAAAYSHTSRKLVRRWLDRETGAIPRQMEPGEDRYVTFLDFVQTLSVRQLRKQYSVPMQRIRQAADALRNGYGLAHPFARQHELYVFDRDIVYKRPEDDSLIFVSGKQVNQTLLKPVIQPHLARMIFDSSGLAAAYQIHSDERFPIVMRPGRRFGAPTVPSGYTAETLHDAVLSEGGYEQAADAYEVDVDEVRTAFEWFDELIWPDV